MACLFPMRFCELDYTLSDTWLSKLELLYIINAFQKGTYYKTKKQTSSLYSEEEVC